MTGGGVTALENFERLHREMEKLWQGLGHARRPSGFYYRSAWRPPTDVFETENEIVVVMEVAGVEPKDMEIVVDGNCLAVRGCREEKPQFRKVCVNQMEIRYGSFEQMILLPSNIDHGRIRAAYDRGFLTVFMPKTTEERAENVSIRIELG